MAGVSEVVQKEIEARDEVLYKALEQRDVAGAAGVFTEGATLMPPNAPAVQGRTAITDFIAKAEDMLGVKWVQQLLYFELIDETNAYTNFRKAVMENPATAYRDAMIWTKVDGQWYIRRSIYHEIPI